MVLADSDYFCLINCGVWLDEYSLVENGTEPVYAFAKVLPLPTAIVQAILAPPIDFSGLAIAITGGLDG